MRFPKDLTQLCYSCYYLLTQQLADSSIQIQNHVLTKNIYSKNIFLYQGSISCFRTCALVVLVEVQSRVKGSTYHQPYHSTQCSVLDKNHASLHNSTLIMILANHLFWFKYLQYRFLFTCPQVANYYNVFCKRTHFVA